MPGPYNISSAPIFAFGGGTFQSGRITVLSLSGLQALLNAQASCADMLTVLNAMASANYYFVEDGTVYDVGTSAFNAADAVDNFTMNIVDGGVGDSATWSYSAGVLVSYIPPLTNPIAYGATPATYMTELIISDAPTSSPLTSASMVIPHLIDFTNQDLLGYLVPACVVSPTALPNLGTSVKCANFSKIFNPLGIPLKGI